ncbi:response regulator transcription factor [Streptomyces goshikiensis]|uniref:Sensory transduction protein RegX3 n=3 Tax=Streptomyces TaxID=1883 RepID=A0A5D4JEN6_9ACTN|nr:MULTISPECIES: response regulator transcription factor [Streptomyces]ALO08221.1 putative two-component system regulator [Streptomyces venezuelae]TYR63672.1 response regulator transcription factor [Streptomyces parvus]QPK45464.1 response regulator transcription factor [Streptomyces gardneri]WRK36796.1 response regulator transcription factor [Streptomyces venezuelae]CUM41425.1 Phosphate regulon transcriptional regulatory protein PhoB (SphR) [Streptomyces venezuelae]
MHVLIVEDDQRIADALGEAMQRFGHDVTRVATGREALTVAESTEFVLLDLGLPDLDGQEVCRRLRERSWVPIIAVTARAEEVDRILLLQAGADDYLIKPYSMRELLARMDAVARRVTGPAAAAGGESREDRWAAGPLVLDLRTRQVEVHGVPVGLTRREFDLLAALAADAGAVRAREDLINEVWDVNWHGSTRTLDVHVGSLRNKLGVREWIESVRGVGFRLAVPDAA